MSLTEVRWRNSRPRVRLAAAPSQGEDIWKWWADTSDDLVV